MVRTRPLTNNISDFLLMVLNRVRVIRKWGARLQVFVYLDLVALLLIIVDGVNGLFHLAQHQVAVTIVGLFQTDADVSNNSSVYIETAALGHT